MSPQPFECFRLPADALQESAWRVGKDKFLTAFVRDETAVFGKKALHGYQRARLVLRPIHHVNDSIFKDKVTARRNHRPVKRQLLEDMLSRVIAIG
jgi:hypothetical protein